MTRLTVGPNPQIGDNAEMQVHGRALNTINLETLANSPN